MDVRIAFNQSLAGQEVVNVTAWSNFIEDPDMGIAFADQIRIRYAGLLAPFLVTGWTLHSLSITYYPGTGPYTVTYPFTSGTISGSIASDPLPAQTALLGSLVHVGSRPNRGRWYQAGVPESSFTGGLFDGSMRTHLADLLNAFKDGVDADGTSVFLRIGRRNLLTPGYETTNPVDLVLPRSNPAVQRRRRLGFS